MSIIAWRDRLRRPLFAGQGALLLQFVVAVFLRLIQDFFDFDGSFA